MTIFEEMAELALPTSYVDILIDNKIDAIGKPEVHITKLAKGNPLEFKAVTAVVPEINCLIIRSWRRKKSRNHHLTRKKSLIKILRTLFYVFANSTPPMKATIMKK